MGWQRRVGSKAAGVVDDLSRYWWQNIEKYIGIRFFYNLWLYKRFYGTAEIDTDWISENSGKVVKENRENDSSVRKGGSYAGI